MKKVRNLKKKQRIQLKRSTKERIRKQAQVKRLYAIKQKELAKKRVIKKHIRSRNFNLLQKIRKRNKGSFLDTLLGNFFSKKAKAEKEPKTC